MKKVIAIVLCLILLTACGTIEKPEIIDVANHVTKKPSHLLLFKKAAIGNVLTICRGFDDFFYLVTLEGVFEKHREITKTKEPDEVGITWDEESYGRIVNIVVMPEGITVFANIEGNSKGRIYHMVDLNSQPELVYESKGKNPSFFVNEFGIKSYYNGLGSYILAGVYGRGPEARDLLLSKDGGKTFEVIKKTRNNLEVKNSHWHDVAFDIYHGFLWASEGDGTTNSGVHFSDDLGETWRTLTNLSQPTAILPFPDRVVFGRDDGKAGLSYFEKPLLVEDYESIKDNSYNILREFMPSIDGYSYYGRTPIVKGNEAYLTFTLYPENKTALIIATGDFGKSWHFVFMGHKSEGSDRKRITMLVDIDDNYVYARSHSTVYFAEKPEWL
ncbi:MAG: hypothetical protein GX958_02320 [Desulfitobacterium sp.]|nr:hypothetical protein [Desulfitobacterium sp.]